MLSLLGAVILASVFALFSTQNTSQIQLNFGSFILSGVPVYLAILIPLIIGLFAAYFIHIAYNLSFKMTIGEQKEELKKLKNENAEITKENHQLELENTKLKKLKGKMHTEDSF